MQTTTQTPPQPASATRPDCAPAIGSADLLLARACKPEIGDSYRRGPFTIRIAYITNHRVTLAHYESGDFIRESSVEIGRWPHHARATINHGAVFMPNAQLRDAADNLKTQPSQSDAH